MWVIEREVPGAHSSFTDEHGTALYRDPRRNGKVVKRSLKTSDAQVAQQYKTHLDRIPADKTLWNKPHDDCPQRVREIWLWDQNDVSFRISPSRTSTRVQASSGNAAAHRSTRSNGRFDGAPRPAYGGAGASRSRMLVFDGTFRRYVSPNARKSRRNRVERPISSSPAIHPCSRRSPFSRSISKASSWRVRKRMALGTPAFWRRLRSRAHSRGRNKLRS